MDMKRVALLILTAAVAAMAADKPNFSGTWEMDLKQSDFGQIPPPDTFVRKIDHKEPSLIMTDEQTSQLGPDKAVRSYTTDGKEITYQWNGGEVKSAAHWEGETLVVVGNVDAGGAAVTIKSAITLSADGKTLTESDHVTMGDNEVAAFKLVMVKK